MNGLDIALWIVQFLKLWFEITMLELVVILIVGMIVDYYWPKKKIILSNDTDGTKYLVISIIVGLVLSIIVKLIDG
jgi:hypothetical protein